MVNLNEKQQHFRQRLSAPYCWSNPYEVDDKALMLELFQKCIEKDMLLATRYYTAGVLLSQLNDFIELGLVDPMLRAINVLTIDVCDQLITRDGL
jgi:hypothetical protein